MDKMYAIDAIELIGSTLIEIKRSLDSAERYHQRAGARGKDEEFFAAGQGKPSQARAQHISQNRKVIDELEQQLPILLQKLEQSRKKGEITRHNVREQIVQILTKSIQSGQWEQGLFFRVIEKRLRQILLAIEASFAEVQSEEEVEGAGPGIEAHKKLTVYLSIYQANGNNIRNWQSVLTNLAQHSIGRPTYRHQKDVEKFVRSRAQPNNEAYLVVEIDKNDILKSPGNKAPQLDNEGRELLSLKKNAVKLNNIKQFVHVSGSYEVQYGRLVLIGDEKDEQESQV